MDNSPYPDGKLVVADSDEAVCVSCAMPHSTVAPELRLNKPVLALEFEETPRGNLTLIHQGAMTMRSRAELRDVLARTARNPQGNQLSIL